MLRVRDPGEIAFRLKQEIANLSLWALPPSCVGEQPSPLPGLPSPARVAARLRGSAFAGNVERLADLVLDHRFPIFGSSISTGPHIDWRRDYVHQRATGLAYFRRIPYLDFSRAGDHKWIWELNRHQHLVLLAQAFLLTGRREFVEEISRELRSWSEANPWMRGINWTSALEVAFRALSWVWVFHLAGEALEPTVRRLVLEGLYRHGCYLEQNLSVYFSPNTHLLGEAVALHALGTLFPALPRAERWRRTGGSITAAQMAAQVREDGSHFEQSAYYHLYALDMFMFHHLLGPVPSDFRDRLRRMAEYLAALTGPSGLLPAFGDDDGGRFFHPYGPRPRFARATLATCGVLFERPEWVGCAEDLEEQAVWWLGAQIRAASGSRPEFASRLFADAGTAILTVDDVQVVADAGPFGPGSAGHSHSDTLSFVLRVGGREILIDPGTYTYVSDPAERNRFRGTAAHNTVRVDGADQAIPEGPFRWRDTPQVQVLDWSSNPQRDSLEAVCHYRDITHRRSLALLKDARRLVVWDQVEGPPGEHTVEQFWHFGENPHAGQDCVRIGECQLTISPGSEWELSEGGEYGWRAPVFGTKNPAPVLRVFRRARLPVRMGATFDFPA